MSNRIEFTSKSQNLSKKARRAVITRQAAAAESDLLTASLGAKIVEPPVSPQQSSQIVAQKRKRDADDISLNGLSQSQAFKKPKLLIDGTNNSISGCEKETVKPVEDGGLLNDIFTRLQRLEAQDAAKNARISALEEALKQRDARMQDLQEADVGHANTEQKSVIMLRRRKELCRLTELVSPLRNLPTFRKLLDLNREEL